MAENYNKKRVPYNYCYVDKLFIAIGKIMVVLWLFFGKISKLTDGQKRLYK